MRLLARCLPPFKLARCSAGGVQTSLWSLAAATTAVSCYLAYTSYDAIRSASVSGLV